MATTQPKAGVVETTITTGTAAYQLQGPLSPWRGFIASDDAKIYPCGVYQEGGGFEEGEYTYDHGSRTLSRTTVTANHLGTTSPVDWGAGTKEVSIVLAAARTVLTSVENKYLAHQFMRGFRLYLDAIDTSWISAVSNGIIRMFLASAEVFKIEQGKLTITGTDDSATEGPELRLNRESSSPATNDAIGVMRMTGRDSAQNEITGFKMRSVLTSVTPGAHSSRMTWDISKTGALQPLVQLQSDSITALAGVSIYTGSKSATNLNTVGAELTDGGEVIGVVQNSACAFFSRKGSDGDIIVISRDGVQQGAIRCEAGVVAIAGACLSHPAEWAADVVDGAAFEALGWVVCTADGLREDSSNRHPLIRPSQTSGDPCVYGVVGGRSDGRLSVEASGSGLIFCVGPITRGDLLETSDVEGCARRQVNSNISSSTVAKATQSSPDEGGARLVPCTLLAG